MVHIPQKSVHSLSPESRQTELGLLDAEIGTLRADNKSLRAINRILEQEKKDLYNDRVLQVEKATFVPLVFTTTWGMGPECDKTNKHPESVAR